MNFEEIDIRRASPEDLETLAALGARTFRDVYHARLDPEELKDYVSSNLNPARVAAQLANESSIFLLARVGGEPAGYARLRVGYAPACVRGRKPLELARLYLDQRLTGKGHGNALMRACLDEAACVGCETMWLGVWEQNVRARRFYEKWGFKDVGTHEFFFGGRAYADPVMERPVKEPRSTMH
jgi:ribosomal protein S18 acetylase RimI-like enzyme